MLSIAASPVQGGAVDCGPFLARLSAAAVPSVADEVAGGLFQQEALGVIDR
ncbi:hypothetical protein [Streptomyces sp. NPDC093149]|uniref:hypothetical protein n=1 Tax=Streptomyces sp. NPDC093149 TaxID=3366031 RepID=UPI00381043DA